jgi:hypothetical protein
VVVHISFFSLSLVRRPQFCDPNSPYSSSAISSIKAEMNQYWPNLQSGGTSDTFWSHEWEKVSASAIYVFGTLRLKLVRL